MKKYLYASYLLFLTVGTGLSGNTPPVQASTTSTLAEEVVKRSYPVVTIYLRGDVTEKIQDQFPVRKTDDPASEIDYLHHDEIKCYALKAKDPADNTSSWYFIPTNFSDAAVLNCLDGKPYSQGNLLIRLNNKTEVSVLPVVNFEGKALIFEPPKELSFAINNAVVAGENSSILQVSINTKLAAFKPRNVREALYMGKYTEVTAVIDLSEAFYKQFKRVIPFEKNRVVITCWYVKIGSREYFVPKEFRGQMMFKRIVFPGDTSFFTEQSESFILSYTPKDGFGLYSNYLDSSYPWKDALSIPEREEIAAFYDKPHTTTNPLSNTLESMAPKKLPLVEKITILPGKPAISAKKTISGAQLASAKKKEEQGRPLTIEDGLILSKYPVASITLDLSLASLTAQSRRSGGLARVYMPKPSRFETFQAYCTKCPPLTFYNSDEPPYEQVVFWPKKFSDFVLQASTICFSKGPQTESRYCLQLFTGDKLPGYLKPHNRNLSVGSLPPEVADLNYQTTLLSGPFSPEKISFSRGRFHVEFEPFRIRGLTVTYK